MTQDKFIALTRKGEGTQIEYKTCTEEMSKGKTKCPRPRLEMSKRECPRMSQS